MANTRVLVIKHGALGDIVQGLDAFASLRDSLPAAHITLLTTPPFAGLARQMPWFNDVLVDHRAHALNLVQLLRIRTILRDRWDAILDLQCSRRTARYLSLTDRQTTRWYGTAPGASDPYPDFTGVNNADRMKTAVAMLCGRADTEADLGWLDREQDGASADRQAEQISVPEKALVIVPGCSPAKPSKRWSAERFAALASLAADQGYRPVLVGTSADRNAGDAVLALAPGCLDLIGRTSLAQLARVFARAEMVVGNDTGPVFLAGKTGTPTLMIMGPDTDPDNSAPKGRRADWIKADPIDSVTAVDAFQKMTTL